MADPQGREGRPLHNLASGRRQLLATPLHGAAEIND